MNLLWITWREGGMASTIILHNDKRFIKKCPFSMCIPKLAENQDEAENLLNNAWLWVYLGEK